MKSLSHILLEARDLYRSGDSTWEVLHYVIDQEVEYPDAVNLVKRALNLDAEEVEEMEDRYTNNI